MRNKIQNIICKVWCWRHKVTGRVSGDVERDKYVVVNGLCDNGNHRLVDAKCVFNKNEGIYISSFREGSISILEPLIKWNYVITKDFLPWAVLVFVVLTYLKMAD